MTKSGSLVNALQDAMRRMDDANAPSDEPFIHFVHPSELKIYEERGLVTPFMRLYPKLPRT